MIPKSRAKGPIDQSCYRIWTSFRSRLARGRFSRYHFHRSQWFVPLISVCVWSRFLLWESACGRSCIRDLSSWSRWSSRFLTRVQRCEWYQSLFNFLIQSRQRTQSWLQFPFREVYFHRKAVLLIDWGSPSSLWKSLCLSLSPVSLESTSYKRQTLRSHTSRALVCMRFSSRLAYHLPLSVE